MNLTDEDEDDDDDIEGLIGMHTVSSIFSKWNPRLYSMSVSTMIFYRQCPISFFFKNAINLNTDNIYLYLGRTLHKIMENFYYNITIPIPTEAVFGNEHFTYKNSKDDAYRYFHAILLELASEVDLYYGLQSYRSVKDEIKSDLYDNALKTLDAFAKEEAIRYVTTPYDRFKPILIEGKIKYRIKGLPIPVIGYIDVILPHPNHNRVGLILKDYKNRSDPSGKLYDLLQAYTYALGIYRMYGHVPKKFIFKNIHGKNIRSDIYYDKNIYPLLPESSVSISYKKFSVIERIIRDLYADMMDKSKYEFHHDPSKCPNYFCKYRDVCLINGFIHDEFIKPITNEIKRARLEKKIITVGEHYREGELIDTVVDGFIDIGDYLGTNR